MTSFVRFIVVVLVAGVAVNLAIVILANTQSQKQQAKDVQKEKVRFSEMMADINGRPRRADIGVAEQREDGRQVLETTLYVREYQIGKDGQNVPLPVKVIVIPGSRVSVDGLTLEFNALFADDAEDFQVLRNTTLNYFTHIHGEDQAQEDWFSFLYDTEVPELTRIHPEADKPTFYEIRLWRYLWDLIPQPMGMAAATPPAAVGGAGSGGGDTRLLRAERHGLKIRWAAPAARAVKVGLMYTAYVSADGVTLTEEYAPDVLNSMREEVKSKEGESAGGGTGRGK